MVELFEIALKGDELHDKLGGGIPKSSIVLIEASNGLGKSVLAQRFVYGVLQHDKTVSYISTELTTKGFLKQMQSLGYDVKKKMLDHEVLFLSAYPSLSHVKFNSKFFSDILSTREIFEKDLIVIDTLSHLLVDKDIKQKDTFEVINFLKTITSLDKTIVFCVDPEEISPVFLGFLRNVADIYFTMSQKEEYGVVVKSIQVQRFNGAGGDVTAVIPYKVLAGVGLALEIASGA